MTFYAHLQTSYCAVVGMGPPPHCDPIPTIGAGCYCIVPTTSRDAIVPTVPTTLRRLTYQGVIPSAPIWSASPQQKEKAKRTVRSYSNCTTGSAKTRSYFLAITRDGTLPSAEAHEIIPMTIRVVVVGLLSKYQL
jgi:hypothetical protein